MTSTTEHIDEKKNEEETELEKANKKIEAGNEKCIKNSKYLFIKVANEYVLKSFF
jgi:hypothetical protein